MQKFLKTGLLSIALIGAGLTANITAQPLSAKGGQEKLEQIKQRGFEFLRTQTSFRSAVGGNEDLAVTRVFQDAKGLGHLHVQQTIDNVPVWGGEAIVHLTKGGDVAAFTDNLRGKVRIINTIPSLEVDAAAQLATDAYGCKGCLTADPTVDLWILRRGKTDYLAYRVQLRREDGSENTALPVIFLDAQTGKVIWQYDNLQTATGSGPSLYSGTISFETYQNGTYYMEDIGRRVGTFDSRNSTTSVNRFSDTDNFWNSTAQRAGIDAHYGAEKVYDYYLYTHNRRGIDGNGGPGYYTSANGSTSLISSKVHYSNGYNNAFWNGSYMTYGDGDGSTFTPLVTLDICGHEMTHGVTERTARLVYSNESGALNEAVSDIFGAMVERYTEGESSNTWKIGEDAYTPGTSGDALRYMDNPTRGNQPDYYPNRYTGTGDNGGVHTNSGIANYEFYLLAKGGTTSRGDSMSGIGADKAAAIWYRALTAYMTSSTNFKGARTATINAANAIYGAGSAESNAVGQSWTLVGVN